MLRKEWFLKREDDQTMAPTEGWFPEISSKVCRVRVRERIKRLQTWECFVVERRVRRKMGGVGRV